MGDWLTCFPGFGMLSTGGRALDAGPAAGGGHQHGYPGLVLFVDVEVVAVALPRHDLEVVRRPDGVGQREPAIPLNAQMRFQLLLRGPHSGRLHELLRAALPAQPTYDLTVDVDPQQLL